MNPRSDGPRAPATVRPGACRLLVGATALLLAGTFTLRTPAHAAGPYGGLEVGHWVRLKGTAGGPSPIACTELRRLAGDFLDTDWSIKAVVGPVDSARREFAMGPWRVRVSDRTVYDNSEGNFAGFADLHPGMFIEVEGAYVSGRPLLAAEVDDETDELEARPALRNQLEIVGRVERLDAKERLITVMGIPFQMNGKTKVRSALE